MSRATITRTPAQVLASNERAILAWERFHCGVKKKGLRGKPRLWALAPLAERLASAAPNAKSAVLGEIYRQLIRDAGRSIAIKRNKETFNSFFSLPRRAASQPRSPRAPRRAHVARVATASASPGGGGGPGDGDPDQQGDPPASPWLHGQGLVPPSPRSSSSDLIPSGPEPEGLLAHGLTGGGR